MEEEKTDETRTTIDSTLKDEAAADSLETGEAGFDSAQTAAIITALTDEVIRKEQREGQKQQEEQAEFDSVDLVVEGIMAITTGKVLLSNVNRYFSSLGYSVEQQLGMYLCVENGSKGLELSTMRKKFFKPDGTPTHENVTQNSASRHFSENLRYFFESGKITPGQIAVRLLRRNCPEKLEGINSPYQLLNKEISFRHDKLPFAIRLSRGSLAVGTYAGDGKYVLKLRQYFSPASSINVK